MPELEACEGGEEAACTAEGVELGSSDFEQARAEIQAAWSAVNLASYSRASVTELVKEKESAPSREATGRGQSWGKVIHRLLGACARGLAASLETLAVKILEEEGRRPEEVATAVQEITRVLDSPLWERALNSGQYYSEVPFSTDTRSEQPADRTEDTVLSGTIDLVFKEEDGWVIVDYKTDTVSGENQLAELVSYYTPQLEMYHRAWESVVGEPVREVGLYFTSINRFVPISNSDREHSEKA